MPTITSIVYKPHDRQSAAGGVDYIREPLLNVELVAGRGLRGDRKGGNPNRQVNVLSREWLDEAAAKGYRAGPGQFGEQLIVEGLDVTALPPGTRLRLGDAAELQIVKGRTGCERLEAAQGKSIAGLGPVGVMARVVTGGTIRVGDPVTVLEQAHQTSEVFRDL
jgi:MOSC domain-containing protein YiiM